MRRLGMTLALAIAGATSGQDVSRARAFGRARLADGSPWVGAEVVLLSRAVPKDERVAGVDRLVTRTDERGRFRAEVLPGRAYTVWARERLEDDSVRISSPAERVFASVPVTLDAVRTRRPTVVDLSGFSKRGPVRAQASSDTDHVETVALEIDEDGRAIAPVLPGRAAVEVFSGDGALLAVAELARNPLVVERPGVARFFVREVATGKPVGGARIHVSLRDTQRFLGTTGADGFCQLPRLGRTRSYVADAPGYSTAQVQRGAARKQEDDWPAVAGEDQVDFHAHLGEGIKIGGRIVVGAEPAPRCTLVVRGLGLHFSRRNSRVLSRFTRCVVTDEQGRFTVDHLIGEYPSVIDVVPSPDVDATLQARFGEGLRPRIVRALRPTRSQTDIELDLAELRLIDLRLTGTDALPADRAKVELAITDNSRHAPPFETCTDRRGAIRILVGEDSQLALGAALGDLSMFRRVRFGERIAEPRERSIALAPPRRSRGRIVDPDGRPIAGVRVSISPGNNRRTMVGVTDDGGEVDQPGVWFAPLGDTHLNLNLRRASTKSVESDSDGRFEWSSPQWVRTFAAVVRGKDRIRIHVQFSVEQLAETGEIVIEIER